MSLVSGWTRKSLALKEKKCWNSIHGSFKMTWIGNKSSEFRLLKSKSVVITFPISMFSMTATTSLKIVYDCSWKTPAGISLNDLLEIGPLLQNAMLDIRLRFRVHTIGLIADMKKPMGYIFILIKLDWNRKCQSGGALSGYLADILRQWFMVRIQ